MNIDPLCVFACSSAGFQIILICFHSHCKSGYMYLHSIWWLSTGQCSTYSMIKQYLWVLNNYVLNVQFTTQKFEFFTIHKGVFYTVLSFPGNQCKFPPHVNNHFQSIQIIDMLYPYSSFYFQLYSLYLSFSSGAARGPTQP